MKKSYEFTRYADIKRLHFILEAITKHAGRQGTVLDVGCGNGVITRFMGEHGFDVLGIDVSEKTIAKARSLNKFPNVKFEVKSAEELVADGTMYDAVICSEVLEHLTNPSKLLAELHKAIKPTGILVVTVPNGMGPREVMVTKPVIRMQRKKGFTWRATNRLKRLLGYSGTTTQSSADDLEHVQFFTLQALNTLAEQNGFSTVETASSNFIDDIFPISLVTKRSFWLQKADGKIADLLPTSLSGGFFTVWKKQDI